MTSDARVMPTVGLIAVGLGAYWPQFPGMREGILRAHARVAQLFEGEGRIVMSGLVDSAAKSRVAGELFAREKVDVVFCHITTYATSETLVPAVSGLGVPVVLLNVQPVRRLDASKVLTTSDWLGVACTCAALPEMTAVLIRLKLRFATVTGHLEGDDVLRQGIKKWCSAAGLRHRLKTESLGLLGRPYPGMLDLHIDETELFRRLGTLTHHLNWDDVTDEIKSVTSEERAAIANRLQAIFECSPALTQQNWEAIASVCGALRRCVEKYALLGIVNHFEGKPSAAHAELLAALNPALSILMADGVACPVEGDMKAALAMVVLKTLAGSATLAELYSMDFTDDLCIIGHSGAGDPMISSKRPYLSASEVFHGKTGKGYLTQFFPKPGGATLLACAQDSSGDYRLIAAEGEIVDGPPLGLGDTNCRMKFSCGLRDFMERWSAFGPTHHAVLGLGGHLDALASVSVMLEIPLETVCRLDFVVSARGTSRERGNSA